MGLTERHWFENEDVPENYEWDLEDAVYNSRTNKKHDDDIVRCKDCKHRPTYPKAYGAEINGSWCYWCELHRAWRTDDWFCADGKRQ